MQNDIDAKCQQSRYVNVAKCQSLSNASNKNRGHRSQYTNFVVKVNKSQNIGQNFVKYIVSFFGNEVSIKKGC